jgi:hypothetical protein
VWRLAEQLIVVKKKKYFLWHNENIIDLASLGAYNFTTLSRPPLSEINELLRLNAYKLHSDFVRFLLSLLRRSPA